MQAYGRVEYNVIILLFVKRFVLAKTRIPHRNLQRSFGR